MRPRLKVFILALAFAGVMGGASVQAALATQPPPAEDIRDIHGPIVLPAPRPVWPILAGAGLIAAAGGAFALYVRRRPGALAPAARALRALDDLRPFTAGDARAFSFTVSEIVRRYVEEAFAVRAAHHTTEELLAELMRDASPVAAHRAELAEFLRYCDLAKFAGWSLSPADMTAMLASAEAFVRATEIATPAPRRAAPAPQHPAGQGASA